MTCLFGMDILDTFTCQIYHQKIPKLTVKEKLVMQFDGISPKNENMQIYHEKYYKLDKNGLTLKNMFDDQFKETDLNDLICENCSDINGKSTKSSLDHPKTLKKIPMILIIILKITQHDWKTETQRKIKPE